MFEVKDVTDVDIAFGRVDHLMPNYDEIPDIYKRGNTAQNKLFSEWMFKGLKLIDVTPNEGVDTEKALRHLVAIMRSFAPKHEHKEAAWAYLFSQWFSSFTYKTA